MLNNVRARPRRSMPPAIASLTTRLFDACPVAGQRGARRAVGCAASRGARDPVRDRGTARCRSSRVCSPGASSTSLLACCCAARRSPRAMSLALARAADPAVAVQARRAADDGELRRPDDHRSDTFSFLMNGLSRSRLQGRDRDRALGASRSCLIWYFDPLRMRRGTALARRARHASAGLVGAVARGAERSVGGILRRELFLEVHALRRDRDRRL